MCKHKKERYSYATRYKELDPLTTINRIRNILYDLKILTKEEWCQSFEGYYSLNLSIVGTEIFSNGKGTSYEYALASAYGELIERLQNFVVYKQIRAMDRKALEYKGFYLAPDEKYLSINEILHIDKVWKKVFTFEAENLEDIRLLLEGWKMADYLSGEKSGFVSLPYFNVTKNCIDYIPAIMLIGRYGSNGMCAGNTVEEALVQGISEIIERHVNFKIIKEKISPPTIPESYIVKQCPNIYKLIEGIKQKGQFEIIIKDCSLKGKFPCVGIIFSDKRHGTYSVRFGAHPNFEIALERCLMELMQGKRGGDFSWMTRFSYLDDSNISKFKNKSEIFSYGFGRYPTELFMDDYDYMFTEFKYNGDGSNKDMLIYLTRILQDEKYNVLIRDVSFLKFPSFHVVVPFFSEANDSNQNTINLMTGRERAASILANPGKACNKELGEVIEYMKTAEYGVHSTIVDPLHMSFNIDFPWRKIKRDLFMCFAYYNMGNLGEAYKAIERFLKISEVQPGRQNLTYYACIKDYIGACIDGSKTADEIFHVLVKIYPKPVVEKVISSLKVPGVVFSACGQLPCFECYKCSYVKYCTYLRMENLYKRLKDEYAKNVIEQKGITEFGIF